MQINQWEEDKLSFARGNHVGEFVCLQNMEQVDMGTSNDEIVFILMKIPIVIVYELSLILNAILQIFLFV